VEWSQHFLERRSLERTHPLRYLFFELTRRCNRSCAYCGSDCAPSAAGSELGAEDWADVARQVARDFDASTIMLALTGGEPLLVDGIVELCRTVGSLRFPFGMVSNGTLLHRDVARQLVDAGMTSISLSLDGPPAVNDRLRGAGATQAVERAASYLQDAGFRGKCEIITTVTRPVVPLLDETRRYVSSLRVALWRVAPVIPIGRASTRPDLLLGRAELREMMDFILRARRDELLPEPEMSEEGYLGDRYEGQVRPYLCQCRAGVTIGGIRADGRIGACPELGDWLLQGDIRTDRFRDVWRHRYRPFRDRSWTRHGPCRRCSVYRRCQGGALHLYPSRDATIERCLFLEVGQSA
jgi:radical SAM protein with 4Fe4S-binding SPASM domain